MAWRAFCFLRSGAIMRNHTTANIRRIGGSMPPRPPAPPGGAPPGAGPGAGAGGASGVAGVSCPRTAGVPRREVEREENQVITAPRLIKGVSRDQTIVSEQIETRE